MREGLSLRPMQVEDVDQVLEIENVSFSQPWSRESMLHELQGEHKAHYIVAVLDGAVCGYAGFWQIFDEAHITNVAVRPDCRNQKIGEALLWEMDRLCRRLGILYQTLEVRVSNMPARRLYSKVGFASAGIRPGYYEKPRDDADILWKEVPNETVS